MKFTDDLYTTAKPLWQKSMRHPFIQELAAGTLPLATFRYYLKQDQHYLMEFGKLHEIIAAKVTDPQDKGILLAGAGAEDNEETLIRNDMLNQLTISQAEIAATPLSPATYKYVTHMYYELNAGSPARAIAALLPCYWLYSNIGKQLSHATSPVPIYQQFIDGYAADAFTTATTDMIDLVNRESTAVDAAEQVDMKDVFMKSSEYELEFWEMAYTKEKWPYESLSI